MKKKQTKLDQFKGQNPFIVPDGYMEGLTDRIMSQLPEKEKEEVRHVSMMERVKPWLYLAAVFAGLGLFFRAIVGLPSGNDGVNSSDSLLVRTEIASDNGYLQMEDSYYDEDEEYLEYIETRYANYILAEELSFSE